MVNRWLAAAALAVLPALTGAQDGLPKALTTASSAVSILPASVLHSQVTRVPKALLPNFQPQGWLALVCAPAGCELRPATLALGPTRPSEQNYWPIEPRTCKPPVRGESTVVLIKGLAATAGRPVPTWFTPRTPRRVEDAAAGSMGVRIDGHGPAGGRQWHIVPRWNPSSEPPLQVYLEAPGARAQVLGPIGMKDVDRGVGPKDLLVWAGDLDGDGRIDLITRTNPNVGPNAGWLGLVLWLSSRAADGEQVGQAAQLESSMVVAGYEEC